MSNISIGISDENYEQFVRRLGDTLRKYKKQRGHTYKTLGKATGIDYRTVEKHCTLTDGMPLTQHLLKYCEYFGADFFTELFEPTGWIECPKEKAAQILREQAQTLEGGV